MGAGVALDGIEGQAQAAGALEQVVDLLPALTGGLFVNAGGP